MKWFSANLKRRYDLWAIAALFVIYLVGLGTEPPYGDGTSFTLSALKEVDMDTNATSHFLYGFTLRWLAVLVGESSAVFWLFPLFSAVMAVLSVGVLNRIMRMLDVGVAARAIALLAFGLSFTFWRNAETVEVYTYNTLFCVGFILQLVKWSTNPKGKYFVVASALLGIALLIHIQNILWIPAWFFWSWKVFQKKPSQYVAGFALLVGIASFLVIPPLLLDTNSIASIFFDHSFKDEVLSFDPKTLVRGFALAIVLLLLNFALFLIPIVKGALSRSITPFVRIEFALMFLATFGFAARYDVPDSYVFFIPAYVILTLYLAVGLERMLERQQASRLKWFYISPAMLPLLYLALTVTVGLTPQGKKLEKEKGYKGGVAFFTWPTMRGNPGTLRLPDLIDKGTVSINQNSEILRNLEMATELKEIIKK